MSVLVSAAPLYLSIGTGLFSLYSIPTFCSLGSRPLTSLCFLVPFLLVIDSILALVVLGNTSASLGLVHTEFVLQVVVRLSLNLLNALILHPSTLPLFLARPAFGYKFQTVAVATLAIVATCSSIFEAIMSVSTVIPSKVSFVGLIVPPFIFALLLRVAVVSRKWNSSPSNSGWDLLTALQLPALAMSIARAWPADTIASAVGHFCLFFWTTGTLLSILHLAPSSRAKSPKQYHVAPRRIQHTTVSEDFQSNHDPFAGPLGHQHRYHLPMLPDVDPYDYGEERPSPRKQGAIRTQYSSESSTQWLLAHPNIQSLPSFPPPVHLMPPVDAEVRARNPLNMGSSTSPHPPPAATAPMPLSRDRTPTQSLYVPESLSKSIHGDSTEEASPPPRETESLPSFELDTPDQTFSSDIDISTQINDSRTLEPTVDGLSPGMADIDEEKDGETPRLPSVLPP